MSDNVKIELILNAEDASLVMSAIKTTGFMLNQSIDHALSDGLLPVVRAARADVKKIDIILEAVMSKHKYESDTFEVDEDAIRKKQDEAREVIEMLAKKMAEKPDAKEEGKDWDKAGDNVVSILDKFKKDKSDDKNS